MNISRFLRRYHLPLMLLLGVFFPLMYFLGSPFPQSIWRLTLFPCAYALLAALLIAMPGRMRIPLLAAGCALSIGAGFALFDAHSSLMMMPAAGAAALFFALSYADKKPEEVSPLFYTFTLAAHIGTLFLLHAIGDQETVHSTLYHLLYAGFVLYLLLFLLTFSRISLNNAALSRYRLPAGISRVCTALTFCFFALALAISSLPAVISGVYAAVRMLRSAIGELLLLIARLLPEESSIGGLMGSPMPMMPEASGVEYTEPSLFFIIFEKIATVLTIAVLIAGSVVLLRMLLRLLRYLARRLLEHLQHYTASVTEDYEDEITDTRQEDADRSVNLLRRRMKRRTNEYPDTPAGKIRRSYARLLRTHSEWNTGSTARENLSDPAAALYERARYSAHPITPEDADRFDQATRRL